ncbi:MAG TPA: family 16 glycoside hydrolase, partial [Planctomycetota bacterium]
RPTRLIHVVAGGDYGWRTGSSKWPDSYPDSLPAALDVGRGSPTGLVRYDGDQFPSSYHGALLGGDWSQGLILAFRPHAAGAGYTATSEVLVRGLPLNVTDLVVEADGSVLFTTGGRGTRGAVYRLRYAGARVTGRGPAGPADGPAPALPNFDARSDDADLIAALAGDDRFVRFAAARQLETRDPHLWESAALATPSARARAEALVVLARQAAAAAAADVARRFGAAVDLLESGAVGDVRVAALRALELMLLDGAVVTGWSVPRLAAYLQTEFPSGERVADRQMAGQMARLEVPGAVGALLDALEASPFREEQIYFAYAARAVQDGWDAGSRRRLLDWFEGTLAWPGGFSMQGYLRGIRDAVLATAGESERAALLAEAEAQRGDVARRTAGAVGAAPRDFERTLFHLQQTLREPRRDLREGARVFRAACLDCHQLGGEGRGVGPDLSTVAARFVLADQLEAALRPNRVISDQYRTIDVWTRDGGVATGMPLVEDADRVLLLRADLTELEIPRDKIRSSEASPVSLMPEGLLDPLSFEEIADLFALLTARPEAAAAALAATPKDTPPAWQPLYDGESLAGWRTDAPLLWTSEGEVIHGVVDGEAASHFLIHERPVGDFRFEFEIQVVEGNSGLQFRSAETAPGVLAGYQADAGDVYWGSLYEERGRGMLFAAPPELWQPSLSQGGWNHYVVEAVGDRIRIQVNGMTTTDLSDDETARGLIGFQLHGGGRTEVRLRHLRIQYLGE